MLNISIKELISVVNGELICGDIEKYGICDIRRISYDSRNVDRETLFVPLLGENVDSHKYISQVFMGEGRVSLAQHDVSLPEGDKIIIMVNDTVEAVKSIAEYCRRNINIPIIGVTGSVGKTTTREMIAIALSSSKKVFATPGNKNSQLGTPITLCDFDDNAEIAVLEMGISMPGEMSKLADMVRPDCAVFTNVGVTHIENLGTRKGILEEKMHITDHMADGAAVFINGDNDMLHSAVFPTGIQVRSYGLNSDCYSYAEDISDKDGMPVFTAVINGKKLHVELSVLGKHNIYNALAALSVCEYYGLDLVKAADAMKGYSGYLHRGQILYNGDLKIIDDTYNAAPDSMKAAIDILSSLNCRGRRIAVLADMKELGDTEIEEHKSIGRYISGKGNIDILITYGELAEYMTKAGFDMDRIHTNSADDLESKLYDILKPGDAVLFKGSNSMKLFNMVDKVMSHEFC